MPQRTSSHNNRNIIDISTMLLNRFLEPVTVRPSETEINNAIRNVRFCDILQPTNNTCPISMEEFNDNDMVSVIRHCGHVFNRESLNTWFTRSCYCPVCRFDIRTNNQTHSTIHQPNQQQRQETTQDRYTYNNDENRETTINSNTINSNIYDIFSSISEMLLDVSGNVNNLSTQSPLHYYFYYRNL